MKRLVFIIGAVFFASILWLGCGGGGSNGGGVADLQGTWLGWIEDDKGIVEEFTLEIDGAGKVIDAQIGASHYGTGHINESWDENVFHIRYSNPVSPIRHGIMIVDDQYSHATYGNYGSASSDYYLGALEKGVMLAPLYSVSDIVASYPVGGAYTGSAGVWEGDPITMTVIPALTFTGNAPAPEGIFSGDFSGIYDSSHGRYAGSLIRTTMTMDITAYVSPDGSALSAFAWETGTTPDYLEDFILMGLKK
jgi:hypothetical protein